MKIKLDDKEKELLDAYDADEWVSVSTPENISKYQQMARNTLEKVELSHLGISNNDLNVIQEIASKEGFSCKEFIANILHKYAAGQFVEKVNLA